MKKLKIFSSEFYFFRSDDGKINGFVVRILFAFLKISELSSEFFSRMKISVDLSSEFFSPPENENILEIVVRIPLASQEWKK